jgi:hypothetical protein
MPFYLCTYKFELNGPIRTVSLDCRDHDAAEVELRAFLNALTKKGNYYYAISNVVAMDQIDTATAKMRPQ